MSILVATPLLAAGFGTTSAMWHCWRVPNSGHDLIVSLRVMR